MKENWIKSGYEIFAIAGAGALKVEVMAKKLNISKSSFYHHFTEMEIFMEQLLHYHLLQAGIIARKESAAQKINPDLINILVDHKTDLLFNRQLRFNQDVELFKITLAKSTQITGKEHVQLFTRDLQLKITPKQLEGLLELAMENFFLQITYDNLNHTWLARHFDNFKRIAQSFE